tara:strand:+ start:1475 stop:2149 length:675 start_codon:yes stop_codon:yes gene_type:complete
MTGTELSSNLGLRLEDPAESIFTASAKVDAINLAQKTVVNMLHNGYLTELEATQAGTTSGSSAEHAVFKSSYVSFASAGNIDPIRGGVVGVRDANNNRWCTMIEAGDVKRLENSYLSGTTSNPVAFVVSQEVHVLPSSITSIYVYYIKSPTDFTSTDSDSMATECELNPALQEIVLDFAEAQLWRMDAKPDRAQLSYNNALAMIKTLNDRYAIDGPEGIGTKGR